MNERIRLLPWSSDGRAQLLIPSGDRSFVAEVAADVAAQQLDMVEDLLDHVRETLERPSLPEAEWRGLVTSLSEALRSALEAAQSGGHRLPDATGGAQR
jgi:hypothetical protein